MALFGVLHTSGSGLFVNRKWLDAVSDNIANINDTVSPDQPVFQERFIEAQANSYGQVGGGARVVAARFGSSEGKLIYEPTNPLAQNGLVRRTDIDLGTQMTNMILAQRGYQANLAIIDRARDAYQAALTIGK